MLSDIISGKMISYCRKSQPVLAGKISLSLPAKKLVSGNKILYSSATKPFPETKILAHEQPFRCRQRKSQSHRQLKATTVSGKGKVKKRKRQKAVACPTLVVTNQLSRPVIYAQGKTYTFTSF